MLVHASEHNGSFELTFDGKEVAFRLVRDEVSWVLERDDPFTAADLPGDLDDESGWCSCAVSSARAAPNQRGIAT